MNNQDPIADMLTRIRNANVAMHDEVRMPSSKLKEALAAAAGPDARRTAPSTGGAAIKLRVGMCSVPKLVSVGQLSAQVAAIAEGRDAIQNLRSSTTVSNELAQAITSLAEELTSGPEKGSATFRMSVEGSPRDLNPIVRDDIYRRTLAPGSVPVSPRSAWAWPRLAWAMSSARSSRARFATRPPPTASRAACSSASPPPSCSA